MTESRAPRLPRRGVRLSHVVLAVVVGLSAPILGMSAAQADGSPGLGSYMKRASGDTQIQGRVYVPGSIAGHSVEVALLASGGGPNSCGGTFEGVGGGTVPSGGGWLAVAGSSCGGLASSGSLRWWVQDNNRPGSPGCTSDVGGCSGSWPSGYGFAVEAADYEPPVALDTSVCATRFVDPVAAWDGDDLKVSWRWTGAVPARGWKVWAPYSAAGFAPTGTADLEVSTTATNSRYGGTVAAPGSVSAVFVQSATDEACWLVVDSIAGTPPDEDQGVDPETGESCGWDLICRLRQVLVWAFVPPEETSTAWQEQADDLATRFPVSLVVGGVSWFSDVQGVLSCSTDPECVGSYDEGGFTAASGTKTIGTLIAPDGETTVNVLDSASAISTTSGRIRSVVEIAFWLAFFAFVWHRVAASFGGRSS